MMADDLEMDLEIERQLESEARNKILNDRGLLSAEDEIVIIK
jgi:hypothetical protein